MWHDVKQSIKFTSGLNDVVLHVLFGMALYVVIAALTKRPVLAILITGAIAVSNEAIDLVEDATGSGWLGSINDVFWTLIVPIAIIIVVKIRRTRQPVL